MATQVNVVVGYAHPPQGNLAGMPTVEPAPMSQAYAEAVAHLAEQIRSDRSRGGSVPHHNFAWRDVRDVPYQLAPPGRVCRVSSPGTRRVVDELASCALLHTAAFRGTRPLTHCAHYYFNRQCNLGAECRFVHAVFIDAAATTLRRAPAPVQLGRPLRAGTEKPREQQPKTRLQPPALPRTTRRPRFPDAASSSTTD